ncbi:high mobility group protein homolog TDP-1-like isoform X1 [Argiope bruennichi]|uniref:High mobility group protein B3 like protein n=1 Tax=Argiope bruennichi TaxID=94029 RepID=A0A8T0F2C9_ARGBR|nr:high mobility group protein homolog TDP-1-like isoform X1 [Argiope bruennichi]KAF8784448.1 High mobility group protein B3 like protein [Argiope bruennichi]
MSADKLYPYGLPLGHRSLSLPTEYDYHQAMAQHAAAVSAGNSSLHPAMSQIPMMPTGLNLSMNSGNHSLGSGIQSGVSNTHHMSHVGNMSGGGKMKKKLKVNKDGIPAPKRATTAYINFTQWYREDQKRNGRQIPKIGDFGKECATKWNSMTGEEKQPFLEVAARDRERYRKEMSIYKPARDVNKPKRPGTAFMLFMADLRKEMAGKEPEGGVAALAKLGGERWRAMSDEEKRKYVEMQSEEKIRYEADMEEYRKKQSIANLQQANNPPRTEEPSNDGSDSLDLPATNTSQLPQLSQVASNSGSSTPSPTETPTPASQSNSASPPPPTLSPGPTDSSTSESPNSSMAALSSLTNPMSLSHAMAMGYAQHTLSNFAHASGMLMSNPNYSQMHSAMPSSAYLSSSNPNYNQAHMQGPYNWN